jgi:cell division protein FtsL
VSLPARRLEPAPSAPRRQRLRAPGSRTSERPARATTRRRRRARRGGIGFVVLSSAVLGSMAFGIVVVNVLLAQTSFRITSAEQRLEELSREHLELVSEQASLSAPGRIATWASRHGMRLPDDIRILHASGGRQADPAGADPISEDAAKGGSSP